MRSRTVATIVCVAVVGGLGLAQTWLERSLAAQSRPGGAGAAVRSRPLVAAGPLPNHWVLGNAIGVWADERDHIWIVHRGSETLANNEKGLELKSAAIAASAAPPVLEFDADGRLVGQWGDRARVRLAGFQSRHLHRSPRQCLDRRQRPRRFPHRQVDARRQMPRQYGKPNARTSGKDKQGQPNVRARQLMIRRTSGASRKSSSSRRPTRPNCRRLF